MAFGRVNNKFLLVVLIVILCNLIYVSNGAESDKEYQHVLNQDTEQARKNILFIGSSYFNFNDLPGVFAKICVSAGKKVNVQDCSINGIVLKTHSLLPSTEKAINHEDWDCIILQGVGVIMAYPYTHQVYPPYTYEPVGPAIELLKEKIHKKNPNTEIIYCLPWAFEDGMTWIKGEKETFEMMMVKVRENTLAYADSIGFTIAPVGIVWQKIMQKVPKQHYLFLEDFNHPSKKGTYAMAYTIYSTVFKESSIKIKSYPEFRRKEDRLLRQVADSVVLNYFPLWHISEK